VEGWQILLGAGGLVGIGGPLAAWGGAKLQARTERRKAALAEAQAAHTEDRDRFEDTSKLAQYMRDEVAKEVERQLGPIKRELEKVTSESHEMNKAVRSREVLLWRWNFAGRSGELPQLPATILSRLGLDALFDTTPTTTP
jgi:hypothetical protein